MKQTSSVGNKRMNVTSSLQSSMTEGSILKSESMLLPKVRVCVWGGVRGRQLQGHVERWEVNEEGGGRESRRCGREEKYVIDMGPFPLWAPPMLSSLLPPLTGTRNEEKV